MRNPNTPNERKANTILKLGSEQKTPGPKMKLAGSQWIIITILVLILIAGFLAYQVILLRSNPAFRGNAELDRIMAKVDKLIVLPEGEVPTLATVTDPEKLRDQPFFAKAQTGFKVLLFSQSQKAVLYDPKANKIVEVAPINPGSPPNTQEGTGENSATDAAGDSESSGQ